MKTEKRKFALGGSIIAAIAASLCCIGPLVAALLGLSGFVAAGFFTHWRPVFLLVTVGMLGLAWYLTYRKPKEACADGSVCATKPVAKWNKVVLWIATAFVVLTAAFPWYSGTIARWTESESPAPIVAATEGTETIQVKIPTMACEACAVGIQKTLRKQDGVLAARVSFGTKEAVVQYDPHKISRQQLIEVINSTGFKAQP